MAVTVLILNVHLTICGEGFQSKGGVSKMEPYLKPAISDKQMGKKSQTFRADNLVVLR